VIYLDSRYADATLAKAENARTNNYSVTVYRVFPTYVVSYFLYTWVATDRWDLIGNKFLNNSEYWWQILDINPEIVDPFNMEPGTLIRIPYE
jgi:prophage DNA circulation protein